MKSYNYENIYNFLINNYVNVGKRYVKFDLANPEIYEKKCEMNQDINDGTFNITRHIWHVLKQRNIPICKNEECSNLTKWIRVKYNDYCSIKCSNSSKKKQDNANATFIKRYGNSLGNNKSILDKSKHTMKERYGVESTFSSEELMDKAKKTNIERYGCEYPIQNSEIYDKVKTTNIERYGVEFLTQNPTVLEKIKNTNIERYGGVSPMSSDDVKLRVKHTTYERYGFESPKHFHLTPDIIDKINNKGWLTNEHHISGKSCAQIANDIGVDITTITRALKRNDIVQYYHGGSKYEIEIIDFLKLHDIKYKHNDRTLISPYEIDILLDESKLCIEFCGLYWHSEKYKERNYHRNKYEMCASHGYTLLTIFEDEWINSSDIVKDIILHKIGKSNKTKIYARKCTVIKVMPKEAQIFLNTNHIQGIGNARHYYGLTYEDELVAVIGFKSLTSMYELNRYATSAIIVGGFSKLFKHFIKTHNPYKIITFVDLRWNNGQVYNYTGFVLDKKLPVDYSYIKNYKRFHKFNFRKSRLKKILGNKYLDDCSERVNCEDNNIFRIYDCGKNRLIWTKDERK